MQIYLASRYSRIEEMRNYRRELQRSGHNVVSRWLDGRFKMPESAGHDDRKLAKRLELEALMCYEDVCNADVFVHFNEEPRTNTRGGRHTELGIAIERGIKIIIIGEPEQLFHFIPGMFHVESWEDARYTLSYLAG